MTIGIRALDFSDMANSLTINFPIVSYSPNPFQNPNFFHPNQYNSPPTPAYQYTPAPTPSYFYHDVQPPPYQCYTTTYTPDFSLTSMLITDITKNYLHYLDDNVSQLDAKMGQIRLLFEKKNIVANRCDIAQEDQFEVSGEACKENVEVKAEEEGSDKVNRMLEILENMGKLLTDMSKSVKEDANDDNTQSKSILPNLVEMILEALEYETVFHELQSMIEMLTGVKKSVEGHSSHAQSCVIVLSFQRKKRQTLVFSATITPSSDFRKKLTRGSLKSKLNDDLHSMENL
ncbi:uncharacterized protein LOC141719455 isoform X1 [Apium graveolens]|uniref:uncharacterized protein LOC141719455 isoform X1 n=1 Tax=Apium graveolens TaxID=4045 RepID=UPI003D7A6027